MILYMEMEQFQRKGDTELLQNTVRSAHSYGLSNGNFGTDSRRV